MWYNATYELGVTKLQNEREVPEIIIKRLPRYYRYLSDLLEQGITRISSNALSEKMKVTASQIRQDFNCFGKFGQQGYGYNVELLYRQIGEILGLDTPNKAVIVGAGNLGHALANHTGFEKRGFEIKGIFDNRKDVVGTYINKIPVMDISEIENFVKKENITIAVLAVPTSVVQDIADKLTDCGILGFLNFSYAEIKVKNSVSVENVHLSDGLMTLSYKIKKNSAE